MGLFIFGVLTGHLLTMVGIMIVMHEGDKK